jgi:hypothetical protein
MTPDIIRLIDLYFSSWGAAKAAEWEDLTNDAPFDPTWLLRQAKNAIEAKDRQIAGLRKALEEADANGQKV